MECPKCGDNSFGGQNKLVGLVTLDEDENGSYSINAQEVIPVRAYLCSSCNYIEFKYENPNEN